MSCRPVMSPGLPGSVRPPSQCRFIARPRRNTANVVVCNYNWLEDGARKIDSMSFFDFLKYLGNKSQDPLDELLIEKGINPEKVMEELYDRRAEEGKENAMNRIMDRIEDQKERGEKIRKMTSGGGKL